MAMHVAEFDSWVQFVDAATKGDRFYGGDSSQTVYPETDEDYVAHGVTWSGGLTWQDDLTHANDGWAEVREEVAALVSEFESHFSATIAKVVEPRFDYTGEYPDVDRFLMGEPECMVTFQHVPENRVARMISLGINGGGSAALNPFPRKLRGAAILALCGILTKMGYSLDVTMEWNVNYGHDEMRTKVHVKDSGHMWNDDEMAYIIANPGAHRRIGFRYRENNVPFNTSSYGHSVGLEGEYDIKIEHQSYGDPGPGKTKESIIAWLERMITGLGINL